MASKNVSHSKVKNSGLLFELLVRQVTVDTMNNVPSSPAVNMVKKYFSPTTELGKELQLYRAFFEMGRLTESKAIQFVDLVNNQRRKLNEEKLIREKYNLVKDIKEHYDINKFMSAKIPSYKIYASIYKTFLAECGDFAIQNISEVVTSRFTLVEHLVKDKKSRVTKGEDAIIESLKNQPEDIRLLTQKLMIDKFNEKYSNLNLKQKRLLREYIHSSASDNTLLEYVKTEIPLMIKSISTSSKLLDKVEKIKLNEVATQLGTIAKKPRIKEQELSALLVAYQIIDELQNETS